MFARNGVDVYGKKATPPPPRPNRISLPFQRKKNNRTHRSRKPERRVVVTPPQKVQGVAQDKQALNIVDPQAQLNIVDPQDHLNIVDPQAQLNIVDPQAHLNIVDPQAQLNVHQDVAQDDPDQEDGATFLAHYDAHLLDGMLSDESADDAEAVDKEEA